MLLIELRWKMTFTINMDANTITKYSFHMSFVYSLASILSSVADANRAHWKCISIFTTELYLTSVPFISPIWWGRTNTALHAHSLSGENFIPFRQLLQFWYRWVCIRHRGKIKWFIDALMSVSPFSRVWLNGFESRPQELPYLDLFFLDMAHIYLPLIVNTRESLSSEVKLSLLTWHLYSPLSDGWAEGIV